MTQVAAFNPNEQLTKLKGKDYLEVKWRLVWFRDQYPHGDIKTELLHLDSDKGLAVFKATVSDGEGGSATGHGSETAKDFGDYLEKAETKAIGRALAALGFGTQFAPELEEGERIVDAPVARQNGHQNAQTSSHPSANGKGVSAPPQREDMEIASPAPDAPTPAQLRARHKEIGLQTPFETVVEKCFNRPISDDELTPAQCVYLSKFYDRKASEKATTGAGGVQ